MTANNLTNFVLFFIFFATGLVAGILFDIKNVVVKNINFKKIKAQNKTQKYKRKNGAIQIVFDVMFCVFLYCFIMAFLFFIVLKLNFGIFRLFMIASAILGYLFYKKLLFKLFAKVGFKIYNFFKGRLKWKKSTKKH